MLSKISQTALRLPREFSFSVAWHDRVTSTGSHVRGQANLPYTLGSILIWTRTTSETATVLWSPLIPYSSSWVPQGPLLGCKQTNRNRIPLGPNITFWWREEFAYIRLKLRVLWCVLSLLADEPMFSSCSFQMAYRHRFSWFWLFSSCDLTSCIVFNCVFFFSLWLVIPLRSYIAEINSDILAMISALLFGYIGFMLSYAKEKNCCKSVFLRWCCTS